MKSAFLLSILTLSLTSLAQDKIDCRTAVVQGYASIGIRVEIQSFSINSFSDENITVEAFNALTSEQQEEIYMRIKPLEVVVSDAIRDLTLFVEPYLGTVAMIKYADVFANIANKRQNLRTCVE
jgi:hypothetical protein